ncbi:MAG: VOC family protein [Actinomycetota bacterium]
MIPVKDLEKTRRFYEDVLVFTPEYRDPGGIDTEAGAGGSTSTRPSSPGPRRTRSSAGRRTISRRPLTS